MIDIKKINGNVCASKGFLANGIYCGIKKNKEKKDLAIIYSNTLCSVGAVYTQNKACGAILVIKTA